MPNQFLFENFFISELIAGTNSTATALSIPPTDAVKLPLFNTGFYLPLSLWDGQNPPEIVWCSSNNQSGTIGVLRGQEGTSAFAWGAGTQVRSTITAAVLNAALAAYNSGLILLANYLPLAGGTLTGPLILAGDPTTALGAATKRYVDTTAALYLPLTGGVLSGDLSLSGHKLLQVSDPVVPADGANKRYVDKLRTDDANILADRSGVLVTAGTGTAYTLATTAGSYVAAGSLVEGVRISCRMHATSGRDATMAVDGNPAIGLRLSVEEGLPAAILPATCVIDMVYSIIPATSTHVWMVESVYQKLAIGTTGTSTAYIVSTGLGILTLDDGLELQIGIHTTNTGPATLAVDGLAAKPLRVVPGTDLYSGQCPTNCILPIRYNATAGEWTIKGVAQPQILTPMNMGVTEPINLSLAVTVNAPTTGQMTIAMKQADGTDPTVARPIQIPFADANGGGGLNWRQVTAPNSMVVPTGSTFGISATSRAFRLWLVAFDYLGSVVLGLFQSTIVSGTPPTQAISILSLAEWMPVGSAIVTAGATQSGTYYTAAAIGTASFKIIGFLDFNQGFGILGNFNAPPTWTRLFTAGMPKPNQIIQRLSNPNGLNVNIGLLSPCNFVKYHAAGVLTQPGVSSYTGSWQRNAVILLSKTYPSNSTATFTSSEVQATVLDAPPLPAGTITYQHTFTASGAPAMANENSWVEEIMV